MPTEESITTVENFIRYNDDGERPRNTQMVYRRAVTDFENYMGFTDEQLFQYSRDKTSQPTKDLQQYQVASGKAGKTRGTAKFFSRIIRAFLSMNEWTFRKKSQGKSTENKIQDGSLSIEILQKMMDIGSIHQRVILETMISTGARIGELAAVRLSDLHMDRDPAEIRIPGEFTKNGKPVTCYLTSECRKYMEIWLLNRDEYLQHTEKKAQNLKVGDRSELLFGCSSALITSHFRYLVEKATGGKQPNINPAANGRRHAIRHPLHPHSCRKYFFSKALPTFGEIMANGLMNHKGGYLEVAYGRIPEKERRATWKENEHVLFITDISGIKAQKNIEEQGKAITQLRIENARILQEMEDLKRIISFTEGKR
jgi:integrase